MSHDSVFIVKAVVGAGVIRPREEACHFVLIEVNQAYIAVVILIVDIVHTAFAVR